MPAYATPDRRLVIGTPASLLVAPFCHSPTRLSAAQRALFRRDLPPPAFEALLRTTVAPLRQNVARVFAAALLAEHAGVTLAFVEGWRCHVIEGPAARAPRLVTGSWLCHLILRMLQRRGLAAAVRPVCRNASRCTWDEVQTIAALAPVDAAIVGIAGFACPSAARARRYLRRVGHHSTRVHSPGSVAAALAAGLDPAQLRLFSATRLRLPEAGRLWLFECLNWTMHACSELERRLSGSSAPLEQRLAHRLRRDRVPWPPASPQRVGG